MGQVYPNHGYYYQWIRKWFEWKYNLSILTIFIPNFLHLKTFPKDVSFTWSMCQARIRVQVWKKTRLLTIQNTQKLSNLFSNKANWNMIQFSSSFGFYKSERNKHESMFFLTTTKKGESRQQNHPCWVWSGGVVTMFWNPFFQNNLFCKKKTKTNWFQMVSKLR